MYQIHFINQKKSIQMEGGTIAQACDKTSYPLNLVCGGKGTCGKCMVTIEQNGVKQDVLACKTQIEDDMIIYLENTNSIYNSSILTSSVQHGFTSFSPAIRKEVKSVSSLTPEECGAYLSNVNHTLLQKFSHYITNSKIKDITFVYYKERLIDVQPGNFSDLLYGGAIDIGTTSVVLYIYDLITGQLLETKSTLNEQITLGADVITRILHCQEEEDGLAQLNQKIISTIATLIEQASQTIPDLKENLYHLILCGNSTMQHLFLNLNPTNLGMYPFVNICSKEVETTGNLCHLPTPANTIVEFLPLLGGFVGADTTSVLLTLPEDDKKYLVIDLGTNGEIAVGNRNGYLTASTACGPALEGGNIECGMRGSTGAIEKISLAHGYVKLQVIGNVDPIGICGSGIIDAVDQLRQEGLIDDTGLLLSPKEYEALYPNSPLLAYLEEPTPDCIHFYFSKGEHPVYLSQKDIRQIQLAKSSIYSGCITLLDESHMTLDDIDCVILAGAFGNYIDIPHALNIGLLPPVPVKKVHSIGNGAGQGVQCCLLDVAQMDRCKTIPTYTTHVELASSATFMEEYIMNMNFSTYNPKEDH